MVERAGWWSTLWIGIVWVLVSGCGPADSTPPVARAELRGDSPLIEHFREAERESGVPAEILASIAFVQTRLSMQQADALEAHEDDGQHAPREWGLMAIGTGGLTSLEVAAMLIRGSTEQVAGDARWNIRAAAALIAKSAHARGVDSEAGLAAWAPAVEAYGGDTLWHAVEEKLGRGFKARDDEGFELELVGIGLGGSENVGVVSQGLGYPGAIWNPAYSGNYSAASRGAAQINYIVIHTVQGSYSGCISWFKNSTANVSAHYVVRSSDGQITQMVDDSDIAWHDACFNSETIGIEHEGYVSDPGKWYTDAMYVASAKLTAWLCDQYGIPKDHAHIMGHGEAPDCSTHTDPGPGWDWNKYLGLVNNNGCLAQGETCNGKDDDCDGKTDEDGVCNAPPKGYLDDAGCEGIKGWAQDPDAPTQSIDVHLYFGGPAGSGAPGKSLNANVSRQDLCSAIGSCEHGFDRRPPLSLFDGQPHAVHAYGIDTAGGPNPELSNSPKSLTCPTPTLSGVRRHVTNPDSLAAWKFDLFWQAPPLSDEQIAALPQGEPLPAAPALVQSDDGAPEVWLVDGKYRRHVPSPQAMAEWQLSFGDVVQKPAAEVNALEQGPPLRASPVLVKDTSGKVELVDDPFPVDPPQGSGGSGGSSGSTSGSGGTGNGGEAGSSGSSNGGPSQKTNVIEGDEPAGCGCRQARSGSGTPLWLALLFALPLVRRRRKEVMS